VLFGGLPVDGVVPYGRVAGSFSAFVEMLDDGGAERTGRIRAQRRSGLLMITSSTGEVRDELIVADPGEGSWLHEYVRG
jgi:hypothetical protein